ncbi:MAG: PEP-CTERM sorting domain-containing protein [Verrucomicrobia bacterium]|nr:MAG: PEP-CTERM sorting domain-containing protein [Verrucomicrobiota bacterium]
MKLLLGWRSISLLSAAGLCLCSSISTAFTLSLGSGPDVSYFVLESPNLGQRLYEVSYTYNSVTPQDAYFLLEQVLVADPAVSASIVNFGSAASPNYLVTSITFDSVMEQNSSASPFTPFWAHWVADGSAGFPTASPVAAETWTSGSGVSSPYRLIAPGSWDALFYSNGSSVPLTVVPEPSACLIFSIGLLAYGSKRRR